MVRSPRLLLAAALIAAVSPPPARESPTSADAAKLLRLKGDEVQTTRTVWNGVPTVFVDYPMGPHERGERMLVAVQRTGGRLRTVEITVGEHEGGIPDVAAIGFANADHDARKELIVILRWPVVHYDVEGTLFEVRLFDDPKPGQRKPTALASLSRHFGMRCECGWRDGRTEHFRFKTLAAVRRELSRLGF
jgi:hypothetical protein